MNTEAKKFSVNGNTLKMIAIITMLIDHITYVFVEAHILPKVYASYLGGQSMEYTNKDYSFWSSVDYIGRGIGRLAFPIFVFLLVEGFMHTRNVWKYALRLGIFALISEIPFDMAFNGSYFDMSYQNVYFTLLIGLLMMTGFEAVNDHIKPKLPNVLLQALIFFAAMMLSLVVSCDYTVMGIAMIAAVYLTRNNRRIMWFAVLVAIVVTMIPANSSFLEVLGCFSFFLIAFYNGERGSFNLKYFFYAFYPAHILILGLLNMFLLK